MGAYLSEPVTIKRVEIPGDEASSDLSYACCSMQGWRRHQEDAHIAPTQINPKVKIFGVYDGHGGADVARFVGNNLVRVLLQDPHFQKEQYETALCNSYLKIDELILTNKGQKELEKLNEKALEDEEEDAKLMSRIKSEGKTSKSKSSVVYKKVKNSLDCCEPQRKIAEKEIKASNDAAQAPRSKLDEKIRKFIEQKLAGRCNVDMDEKCSKGNLESTKEAENSKLDIDDVHFGVHSGCTATTCLIVDNKKLVCSNAGDSRCVLSRKGVAIGLSNDHNPDVQSEVDRIEKAGGTVSEDGRVEGNLNLSRALGDLMYKRDRKLKPCEQMISGYPEVIEMDICADDEYVIIGCDGIFNVLTNQEVVDFVLKGVQQKHTLAEIAANLCEECMAADASGDGTGCDNETVIIVRLKGNNKYTSARSGEISTNTKKRLIEISKSSGHSTNKRTKSK